MRAITKVIIDNGGQVVVAQPGSPGPKGAAATVAVGSTATGPAGSQASVSNSGTTWAAVLDFTIPKGDQGEVGPQASDADKLTQGTISDAVHGQRAGGNLHAAATTSAPGFMPPADRVTVGHISVTHPVDLDLIATRVNNLDAAVVIKGEWDASAGTFPANAQEGWSYSVSVAGTVDDAVFAVNDRLLCLVDNASETTYAGNWLKLDYSDLVSSVAGYAGTVTIGQILAALKTVDGAGSGLDADLLDGHDSTYFQPQLLHNVAAADPSVNDDSGDGYSVRSTWINQSTGEIFKCIDATAGAAAWVTTSLTLDDLGSAATKDVGTGAGDVPRNSDLGSASKQDIESQTVGSTPLLYMPDALRQQVEAATGGHVTVLYDDLNYPSYMHVVPKFRYEELGYDTQLGSGVATAFVVNGVEKSELFVGQYQGVVYNNRALSLPRYDPRTSIDFDAARLACTSKGAGWHLMTRHEWAAIAFWCMAQGFQPRGNTDNGRAHDAHGEYGIMANGGSPGVDGPSDERIYTGSGPRAWRHNGDLSGIADMVGNVWEWVDGFKLDNGQIVCTADNDYSQAEAGWTATGHYLSDTGTSLELKNSAGNSTGSARSVDWNALPKEAGYTESQLLQRLMISPAGIAPQGRLYARTAGERLPLCGGSWSIGGNAGLAALNLNNTRASSHNSIGLRPAFVA